MLPAFAIALGLASVAEAPSWACNGRERLGTSTRGMGPARCTLRSFIGALDGAAGIVVHLEGAGGVPGRARLRSGSKWVALPFGVGDDGLRAWVSSADVAYLVGTARENLELELELEPAPGPYAFEASLEISAILDAEAPTRFDPRRIAVSEANLPGGRTAKRLRARPEGWRMEIHSDRAPPMAKPVPFESRRELAARILDALPPVQLEARPSELAKRMRSTTSIAVPGFPVVEVPRRPAPCSGTTQVGLAQRISKPGCLDIFDYAKWRGPGRGWRKRFLGLESLRVFVESYVESHQREDLRAAVNLTLELADRLDRGEGLREDDAIEVFFDTQTVVRRASNVAGLLVLLDDDFEGRARVAELYERDVRTLLARVSEPLACFALVTHALMAPKIVDRARALERASQGCQPRAVPDQRRLLTFADPDGSLGDVEAIVELYGAAIGAMHAARVSGRSFAEAPAEALCALVAGGELLRLGELGPTMFVPLDVATHCATSACELFCGALPPTSPTVDPDSMLRGPDVAVMRDRAGSPEALAVFVRGRGSDTHEDDLAIALVADGRSWLIELGQPELPDDSALAVFAASRAAHNAPVRRGGRPRTASACCGTTTSRSAERGIVTSMRSSGSVSAVDAQRADVMRTVTLARPRLVSVRDVFSRKEPSTAKETLRQLFHFPVGSEAVVLPGPVVRVRDQTGACLYVYPGGNVEVVHARESRDLQGWAFRGVEALPAPVLEVWRFPESNGGGALETFVVPVSPRSPCVSPFANELEAHAQLLLRLSDAAFGF
ncbi:MAG: heparinase II/III family protein [Deltaproteobacteria bacterium]|nr:heparinase II/III family protein [Deltaproteobacteria bacterium]